MNTERLTSNEKSLPPFVFPNIEAERGEIERVAREFAEEDPTAFTIRFIEKAKESKLIPLSDEMWNSLENTDSLDIKTADWGRVDHRAVAGHPEAARDWQNLKQRIESGAQLDAPIICAKNGRLHLVSGNTRLMVMRALGQTPHILLVDVN